MSSSLRRFPRTVGTRTARFLRHRWTLRIRTAAAILLISLSGVVVGTLLFAQTDVAVGPFRAEMSVSPSVFGGTEVDIPPLGSLHLDSHRGPIHLNVNLGSLDQERTEALIDQPGSFSTAGQSAVDDVTGGVLKVGLRALGAAVACALLLSALVFRNVRRVAWSGGLALAVTAGSLGLAAGTMRPDSLSEPRYEGLLVNAPAVVGDARRIADNYGRYAEQLEQIVGNVSRIYTTVSSLPVYEPAGNTTRILHVSDLHLNPGSWGIIRTVVQQFEIDAVVDTGDIVDWGSSTETSYVAQIADMGVPYIYVRGNHDSVATESAVARQPNARVLNNTVTTVNGLTIAGIADPQFTPDKSETPAADGDEPATSPLLRAGTQLADTIRASPTKVHVALVHDPAMAPPLSGAVPLVLAGHRHQREVSMLPAPEAAPGASTPPAAGTPPAPTRIMVEGSTGGAGLRGLEDEEPTPLALSVLYFDELQELKAYDDIELGGTGQSQVTLERKVVGHDTESTAGSSTPTGPTPTGPTPGGPTQGGPTPGASIPPSR
ncbi:metallophosphoesterase [Jidongwangia harbinensis]|uniref:metallophosphoesterase n=1 Tax=Jidongwangia harbinensis TaxID=2878561 RepID=UPI001CD9A715|nr:metallophosphoesterase [Jidongwangia harbinensis]MCA2217281.1 metallophosphoesterase [Jidongwangia harbinensis]